MTGRALSRLGPAVGWAAIAGLLAVAFVGGRASVDRVVAASDLPTSASASEVLWSARTVTIGRTLRFTGRITAPTTPGPLVNVDGVVTSVPIAGGAVIDVGDVLLEVQLRPIVAGVGTVPAFRDLAEGATGPDVAQLKGLLCTTGFLRRCDGPPEYTGAVTRAVRSWQKSREQPEDGIVLASDIMWFSALPATARPADEVDVGARLSANDRPVLTTTGVPELEIKVTREQAGLVPVGALLQLGTSTRGRVSAVAPAPAKDPGEASDAMLLTVVGPDGVSAVCGAGTECAQLLGSESSVPVEVSIDVVPSRTGIGVPVRAVHTAADDSTYVVLADGSQAPVTVGGASGGMVVVEGLDAGTDVRVSDADDAG